jgi:hypothetical protein
MQSTSCECECPFVKQGFCKNEKECPNYVESWWIEGNSNEPKMIKDCSPKRMLLQQQLLQARIEQMTESLQKTTQENQKVLQYLSKVIDESRQFMVEQNQRKSGITPKGDYEKICHNAINCS